MARFRGRSEPETSIEDIQSLYINTRHPALDADARSVGQEVLTQGPRQSGYKI